MPFVYLYGRSLTESMGFIHFAVNNFLNGRREDRLRRKQRITNVQIRHHQERGVEIGGDLSGLTSPDCGVFPGRSSEAGLTSHRPSRNQRQALLQRNAEATETATVLLSVVRYHRSVAVVVARICSPTSVRSPTSLRGSGPGRVEGVDSTDLTAYLRESIAAVRVAAWSLHGRNGRNGGDARSRRRVSSMPPAEL